MKLHSLLCAAALALSTLAAQADTIVFQNYAGFDERLSDGRRYLNPFAAVNDLFDISGPHGILLNAREDPTGATVGYGEISIEGRELGGDDFHDRLTYRGGFLLDGSGALINYALGNTVQHVDGSQVSTGAVTLYDSEAPGDGPLPRQGDRGIFGFVLEIVGIPLPIECEDDICGPGGPEQEIETPAPGERVVQNYFGWIEIEHGSIIPRLIGVNPDPGRAAVVTRTTPASPSQVPLPAAGWMLLAGLGGFAALGRRKG
ncbi:MAG: VPLPA-CTERM sorting domain-containing protein [Silicimonas sp.]|nr:VPLPA-CTERM sorting domain-containing protein [Silicimonas sp.]